MAEVRLQNRTSHEFVIVNIKKVSTENFDSDGER